MAGAMSCYDDIMYKKTPKHLALARLAVWGAILDVHKAEVALTDGQITTAIDAAPDIVGKKGLEALKSINSHEEMSAFILNEGPRLSPGIMAASQLWSLFHLTTKTWPDHLFRNSEITAEGSALLGLTSYHLQRGDFTKDEFKPREFLVDMVGKAHKMAEDARTGTASDTPTTPADSAATFIAIVRQGDFEALSFSSLAETFQSAAVEPAIGKSYGFKSRGQAAEVSFVRPDDTPSVKDLVEMDSDSEPADFDETDDESIDEINAAWSGGSELGGDGAFLGYRSLTELKRKFVGVGIGGGKLPPSVFMKRHPFTHATYCKYRSQAEQVKLAGGSLDDDDVYSAALAGKSIFMAEHYTPIFSQGVTDANLGVKGGGDVEPEPGKGKKKKKEHMRIIPRDVNFDPETAAAQTEMFAEVEGFSCARFADANQQSKKLVMALFDGSQTMVRGPETALFGEMQKAYRANLGNSMSHDEAIAGAVDLVSAKHPKEDKGTFWTYSSFLGRVQYDSLDQKLGEDSMSDIHNMMPHDLLEQYNETVYANLTEGQDGAEIKIHSAMLDLVDTHVSVKEYVEDSFKRIHGVLIANEEADLANALEKMSMLSLPSTEEVAAICDTLTHGDDSTKTGRVLAGAFARSYDLISHAVKTVDASVAESVHLAAHDGPDVAGDSDNVTRMAARMQRVLTASLPEAMEPEGRR